MSTQSVSNTTASSSAAGTGSSAAKTMNESDFLNLLVTELKNQNPLDPMNGSEYAAQLAQFSSVEQLSNINNKMDSYLSTNETLNSSINNALATTFIGKAVYATTNKFQYDGSNAVQVGCTLSGPSDGASIKIYNSSGSLVRTLTTNGNSGYNTVSWDGKTDDGTSVASGAYSFSVSASNSSGASPNSTSYIYGNVDAVRYNANGTSFVIDGQEVSLSNILEIAQEK